jgi:hypothetical protein
MQLSNPESETLMPNPAESLILRGLHLVMRASFSPNDPVAQAKHFMGMQTDLGPWFSDYVKVMSEADAPSPARLGRSTTRELLDELRVRIEVNAKPGVDYLPLLVRVDDLSTVISRCVDGGLDYIPIVDAPTTAVVGGDTHP